MILFRIAYDLGKTERKIASLQGQVVKAIAGALNEGGDKVRTQTRRAMREQTGLLRLRSVTSRSSTMRAHEAALAYRIVYRGKPSTKPDEFRVRVIKGRGGGVVVDLWGKPHLFKRSFQTSITARMRARLGRERMPIRGFDGPNLAKEAIKRDGLVARTFLAETQLLVPPIIAKRLARVLE